MEEVQNVTTINNVLEDIKKCRLINGKYYLIGDVNVENSGDVYLINDRYIRFETGRLVYNITNKSYELNSQTQSIKGIINVDKNGNFIYGNFIFNPLYDFKVFLENNTSEICHRDCKLPLSYREQKSTGNYYHIKLIKSVDFNSLQIIQKSFKENFKYDSNSELEKYKKIFELNYKPEYLDVTESISKVLGNLSFGLEFETIKGLIPNNKLNCLPLIPLRDGSIEGLEYATIPLEGKLGVQAMLDSVVELSKRTLYDNTCSLHFHIGNIPRNPAFILAFYRLFSIISDEMYEMFPLYKKYNFGIKRKNYTKPYDFIKLNSIMDPVIDNDDKVIKNFSILFNYLSESERNGQNFEKYENNLENVNFHPQDPGNNSKWNISHRYHIVNFIPLIFGNKKTIEFRIHTPTYNRDKIINFLLINSILINFTIENCDKILKNYHNFIHINLNTIISNYLSNKKNIKYKGVIHDQLSDYIYSRKNFTNNKNSNGQINYNESDYKYKGYLNLMVKEISENNSFFKDTIENLKVKLNSTINDDVNNLISADLDFKPYYGYEDLSKKMKTISNSIYESINYESKSYPLPSHLKPKIVKKRI